jgi:hypothetical protein
MKITMSQIWKRLIKWEDPNVEYDLTDQQIEVSYDLITEMQKRYDANDEVGFKRAALEFERLHKEIYLNGSNKTNDGTNAQDSAKIL